MRLDANGRPFDLIVLGATGFTGQFVLEHLKTYGANGPRWALAGRSIERLRQLKQARGLPEDIAIFEVDPSNQEALVGLCSKGRTIISLAGPYQVFGDGLIRACLEAQTDYIDLCGEPLWMAEMIRRYGSSAKAAGVRFIFSCGFDSIPSDLGVYMLQMGAIRHFGIPCQSVKSFVRFSGGLSGGTQASGIATATAVSKRPELRQLVEDPLLLCSRRTQADQPRAKLAFDRKRNFWTAPFLMGPINTQVVHRSNELLGSLYGDQFTYCESQLTGAGLIGAVRAFFIHQYLLVQNQLIQGSWSRHLIQRYVALSSGQGPGQHTRARSHFKYSIFGETRDHQEAYVEVSYMGDPGYEASGKMIVEAALVLLDTANLEGGFWTPASALGDQLIHRLGAYANINFRFRPETT